MIFHTKFKGKKIRLEKILKPVMSGYIATLSQIDATNINNKNKHSNDK